MNIYHYFGLGCNKCNPDAYYSFLFKIVSDAFLNANNSNAIMLLCHRFDFAVGASASVLRREATVAIANGYNGIQMVKIGRIIFAIGSSYSNFSNN